MLAKLVKFVVFTRFSKPLLGLIAFFLVYGSVVRGVTQGSEATTVFSYYAIGASIFLIIMSLLLGGLFVMKSDRDYLLTLPLSRRDLSISLFTAQFIGSGITIVFMYSFYIPGSSGLVGTIVSIADLALLACLVTALSVISNLLETWKRLLLAMGLAAWCATAVLGFPFTPVSSFNGNLAYGSLTLFLLTAIVLPVALRELAYLELGSMRTILRSSSSEYKQNMSFQGMSPIRALYSYHLAFLELAGRINIGGSTSYRTARVKTRTVILATLVAGVAYFVFTVLSPVSGNLRVYVPSRAIVYIISVFMGAIVLVLMSLSAFSNERGWLAFTAMDPATYLRHLVLSRVVSTLAIVSPFGIADIIIAIVRDPTGLNSAVALLVTIPAASIIAAYIVARAGAVQQVKEEGIMPGQFDLRQLVVILPVYFFIGLIIVSLLSFVVAIIIAAILGFLSLLLLGRASIWRGIAYRLTEKGFI